MAVQRCEIKIRRGVIDVAIVKIGRKEVLNISGRIVTKVNNDLPWIIIVAQYHRMLETLLGFFLNVDRAMMDS